MIVSLARGVILALYPGLVSSIDSVVGLVYDKGEAVLIDSGSGAPGGANAIVSALAWARIKPGGLKWILNTHCHIHNAGNDYALKEMLGVSIAAHEPDSIYIERGDPVKTAAREAGLEFKPVPVTLHMKTGQAVFHAGDVEVTAVHTPGHTPGSTSYMVETDKRVVFAGDALGRLSREWGSDPRQALESLDRIEGLDAEVLCTSAGCVEGRESVRSLIGEARRDYSRMLEEWR